MISLEKKEDYLRSSTQALAGSPYPRPLCATLLFGNAFLLWFLILGVPHTLAPAFGNFLRK